MVFDGIRRGQTEGQVGEDGGETGWFFMIVVLVVTEDHDAAFGTMWHVVPVMFDEEAAYHRNIPGCIFLSAETLVFAFVDAGLHVMLEEALLFLLVDF